MNCCAESEKVSNDVKLMVVIINIPKEQFRASDDSFNVIIRKSKYS